MTTYLVVVGIIFALALGGVLVDRLYRRFAAANPKLGPFRDTSKCSCCKDGDGCGDDKAATTCVTTTPVELHRH